MNSDNKLTIDWLNLPADVSELSLWDALHDGDVLSICSDLLARTVTLVFDVFYVRDFHHLPADTRFQIVVHGVQSVRAFHSVPWPGGCPIPDGATNAEQNIYIAEYHHKWREESMSWTDFERLIANDSEVSIATLVRGTDALALKFGFLVQRDSYVEAYIRGETIDCYVGEKHVAPEEFVASGKAYWNAFAKKQKRT